MRPAVFACFDEICRAQGAAGDVLELGATASPDTLLMLPSLAAARSRTGVALDPVEALPGCRLLRADARELALFPAASFDVVLANSLLEHVGRFWEVLAEVRRLARPGALVVYGVPGYAEPPPSRWRPLLAGLFALPLIGPGLRDRIEPVLAGTPTLGLHRFPGDYYRFSEQAGREVLLEGLEPVACRVVLQPPRIIVAGRRPRA